MLTKEKLDQEWIDLIVRARNMGYSVDDIRVFFEQAPATEAKVVKAEE